MVAPLWWKARRNVLRPPAGRFVFYAKSEDRLCAAVTRGCSDLSELADTAEAAQAPALAIDVRRARDATLSRTGIADTVV